MESPEARARTSEIERQAHCRAVFAARYSEILGQSLLVTNFDRAVAEELVHEAFIKVVRSRTDLAQVENLNAFFYRVLRNLHSSRQRKNWNHPCDSLTTMDYLSLRGFRIAERVDLQDRLRKLCAFLCWRKEKSRASSLLLLRSFWGFEPQEIMSLAGIRRRSLDNMIWIARDEARRYLASPQSYCLNRRFRPLTRDASGKHASGLDNLDAQLLELIHESRSGECLSDCRTDRSCRGTPLTIMQLAHVVSCEICLGQFTKEMEIAPPKGRWVWGVRSNAPRETPRRFAYQPPRMDRKDNATNVILDTPDFVRVYSRALLWDRFQAFVAKIVALLRRLAAIFPGDADL